MGNNQLPHRDTGSRQTYLTETHVVHSVDDGEYRQDITQSADPTDVLEFLQKLVTWYEADVDDPRELFLRAEIGDGGFVYIRDRQGGEWVMWSVNEWVAPKPGVDVETWNKNGWDPLNDETTGINEPGLRTVITAIVLTYEEPRTIQERFNRVQIESCDSH